jgi:hypothetical protein
MKSAVLLNALRWCSTAKHFALSRRRSRVQIPVGAMILVRNLISKQNKCETAKKKSNMKLISEDVGRSISSIAVMNMQTQETCGKKVTKPRHRINRLILPDIRKISFFRKDVINFRTLLRVKYVSEPFLT